MITYSSTAPIATYESQHKFLLRNKKNDLKIVTVIPSYLEHWSK